MKIYFDESGNTGCIIPNKNGLLYNDEQRFFVLGGVICISDNDELILSNKYLQFKEKYNIKDELKGSNMMKRENNEMLLDFIDNLIDETHFYVCCYDKIFYLASVITSFFYPRELMEKDPIFYFTQTSALTQEDVGLFLKYCELNAIGSDEASLDFCRFMVNFDFKKIDPELNGYIKMAKLALKKGQALAFPLPFGCYLKHGYTNLINMTSLGESLLFIKELYNLKTDDIQVIHDRIFEFENEYYDSFSDIPLSLSFADSKDEVLLQYADNLASIFRKCCTETIKLFRSGEQWNAEKGWFPTIYARLLKKLSYQRVKWDTAISDQVLPLCIEDMFGESFPLKDRNDINFYKRFMYYKGLILENIASLKYNSNL